MFYQKNEFIHHFNSISNHFGCLQTVCYWEENIGRNSFNRLNSSSSNGFLVSTLIPLTHCDKISVCKHFCFNNIYYKLTNRNLVSSLKIWTILKMYSGILLPSKYKFQHSYIQKYSRLQFWLHTSNVLKKEIWIYY